MDVLPGVFNICSDVSTTVQVIFVTVHFFCQISMYSLCSVPLLHWPHFHSEVHWFLMIVIVDPD